MPSRLWFSWRRHLRAAYRCYLNIILTISFNNISLLDIADTTGKYFGGDMVSFIAFRRMLDFA